MLISLLLSVFLSVNLLKLCVGEEVPVVEVNEGLIRGIKEESLNGKEFYSYMSIPYAEPPIGNLRFKDPVRVKPWDSVLDGTKRIVDCLQIDLFQSLLTVTNSINIIGREDCLHLNVYTSAPNERERNLPVMVFIHGGGFFFGGADQYQPHVLMNREIVLVVIQYRLGLFGFLSTEDSVVPGNMGLKDQQLALKWIKENIENFGGDPNRITIFGESAGGASVHYHILSPGSKGLFNGAIMQSGAAICPWSSNKDHRNIAIRKGQDFNCSFNSGSEEYLKCMQNVNPYYIALAGYSNRMGEEQAVIPLPRVDGEFIDEAPEILMKKGKYNKVNIISGVTKDDGVLMTLVGEQIPGFIKNLNEKFDKFAPLVLALGKEENPSELARQVYKYYLKREDITVTEDDDETRMQLNTDRYFKVCHDTATYIFAADKDVKVYSYQLDHFGQVSLFDVPGFNRTNKVIHMDDLTYLFEGGIFDGKKMDDEEDLKLREIMLDLWVNFARTGTPSSPRSDFTWREATKNNLGYLSLTPSPVMKEDDYQETRKFWSSLRTEQNLNMKNVDMRSKREDL